MKSNEDQEQQNKKTEQKMEDQERQNRNQNNQNKFTKQQKKLRSNKLDTRLPTHTSSARLYHDLCLAVIPTHNKPIINTINYIIRPQGKICLNGTIKL